MSRKQTFNPGVVTTAAAPETHGVQLAKSPVDGVATPHVSKDPHHGLRARAGQLMWDPDELRRFLVDLVDALPK